MGLNTETPGLSIVVNNYNYRRFLGEALDSVLPQMNACDELIVVDDGSTDDSLALLQHYQRTRGIKLIAHANQGQLKSVRVGITAASGDVVVLLDSDDYFLPGYLDRLRDIYSRHPEVGFVFSAAEVGGAPATGTRSARRALQAMQLEPGIVGKTRWSTLLFFEFVGVSTSGISLRTALAREIVTLPESLNSRQRLAPLVARLLRISKTEASKAGLSADGVIVRAASMLDAIKYYDDRAAFFYRIHGKNKYANASALGQWYLRRRRKRMIIRGVVQHFGLRSRPTARELREEINQRHFGLRVRRRFHIRARYCLAAITATGAGREKLAALCAAAGFGGR